MTFDEFIAFEVTNEYKLINLKKRAVYAPSAKLKQVHRFLNSTILEYADFNKDVVFSYRKGFSTRNAVEKHANNSFFFQTDISNFYGNIHQENVIHSLSEQLTHIPISDIEDYLEKIIKLVVVDNHIPAGFSTSPLLSNICLFHFDNALLNYCQDNSLIYTRYSDDLIISGKSEDFTSKISPVIEGLLKEKINSVISLNTAKTKIHKKGHNFKLLGFSILPNGIVTIPSADKKLVESMLYFFLVDQSKFENYVESALKPKLTELGDKSFREYGIRSLSGKLIAFNSMDKKYISKLRTKYGNTLIDMFIRKSVK